jgi:hypothetical protein
MAMYEALAIRDIRDAADVLRPVYDSTAGADGYVSMEVSPYIAHDTAATHEHMVHQCMSGDVWFRTMLDVDVGVPPLPEQERRLEFIRRYAEDSARRLAFAGGTNKGWWEAQTPFFDVGRSKAWMMTRRLRMRVSTRS